MLSRLRNLSRRQRALLAAGVGAAAAAAYYLGTVALEVVERERAHALRTAEQQAELAKEERETERKLHEHFDAIQEAADTKTLPLLLPPLRARLFAACDVESLTAQLREPSLSAADKLALWEELKLLAFARALSCAYAVALLTLLLRLQLNLLGSHSYLSTALGGAQAEGAAAAAGAPAAPARRALSLQSQAAYLELNSYFVRGGGAERLAAGVYSACRCALAGQALSSQLGHAELGALLSKVQDSLLAPPGGRDALTQLLLPPPAGDAAVLAAHTALEPGGDGQLLAAVLGETRAVMAGPGFQATLGAVLDEGRRVLWVGLESGYAAGEEKRALAKLVPLVAAAAERVVLPPAAGGRGVAAAVARLPMVAAFSADVFSAV